MPGLDGPGLDSVESRLFTIRDFALANGAILPELTLAYETYGTLAADGRNGLLATHGYTSSHHAAGRYRPGCAPRGVGEDEPGWWDALIGPGLPIDTDRLFVVSSNMLGSSYGSTSPASRNPATGKPYGPDFPHITVPDIVRAQKALVDHLGVRHLVAVAGPSYGGYQAFQWAVDHPDFVDGIVPAVTAPRSDPAATRAAAQRLVDQFSTDPNWNGGRYYEAGGIAPTLTRMRIELLKFYGAEEQLKPLYPDAAQRQAALAALAGKWVAAFDPNSMLVLRRALETFDTVKDFPRLKAKVLYALSRTDKLFPPSLAPDVMRALEAAGVDARYVEIDSEMGHLASGADAGKWDGELRAFMQRLTG